MINYDDVAARCGLSAPHRVWRATFDASAHLAADVTAWMSSPIAVRRAAERLTLTEEMVRWVVEETSKLSATPEWSRLVAHLGHILIMEPVDPADGSAVMPELPQSSGVAADLVYLLAYLYGAEEMHRRYRERAVPEAVIGDTLADFRIRMVMHHQQTGRWGLTPNAWLQNFPTMRLYGFGRLQFAFARFSWPQVVFRHRGSGATTILMESGQSVRADGHLASADGGAEPADWETTFGEPRAGWVVGNPVDRIRGTVHREPVTLSRTEWDLVIAPGDPVLAAHIPASGRLTPEDCLLSLGQVIPFYRECYPEYAFTGVTCASWLMDPQFEEHLGSEANIVGFTRLFHSVPVPGADDRQMFERVFGTEPDRHERLPTDSGVRRAVVRHLAAGGRWRRGGGVLPRQQLPQ